jgi:hypothetical protein
VNRYFHILVAVVLVGLAQPVHVAFADDPAPTAEQLEQAKKAYGEGKALFDAGKLLDAAEKFKESYKLSRNAVLLYNIGHTLDQAGEKQKALFYYRKFLADAPKNAPQRKDVAKRVDEIEKENFEAELNGTSPTTTGTPGTPSDTPPKKPAEEPKVQVKVKPAGTYTASDFQHQMIESAPPGKPLDVTAFVPEDSGWTVTLYYRGAGDAKFVAKPMRWRYKELVARIPAARMSGTFVQYYVEAKDADGNVVTRSGKSTSPNLINVDASTPPRFYPDFTDESEPVATNTQEQRREDTEEDPLHRGGLGRKPPPVETPLVTGPTEHGNGITDVGSSKFKKAKWISTGVAGGLIIGAVVTYVMAKKQASSIEDDAKRTSCSDGIAPPSPFDSYDLDVQSAGKRYNTWNTLTLVGGIAAAGVAGYFWYKEIKAGKGGEHNSSPSSKPSDPDLVIVPSIGDGFAGAAAAARF